MSNIKVDFAVISAMPEELAFINATLGSFPCEAVTLNRLEFKVYNYHSRKILVTHTGIGTTFAACITALIDNHFNPDYILLSGTAGGIKPGLKLCDVVIATAAFEAEIQGIFTILKGTPFESSLKHPLKNEWFPAVYAANDELLTAARKVNLPGVTILEGTVVSSNSFPAPKEMFAQIKNMNPYSIDMETSALYQYGWLCKKKVIAFRGISNILASDGTDENVHKSDLKGSAQAAASVLLATLNNLVA